MSLSLQVIAPQHTSPSFPASVLHIKGKSGKHRTLPYMAHSTALSVTRVLNGFIYTNKVTLAVKLFRPGLRRRKVPPSHPRKGQTEAPRTGLCIPGYSYPRPTKPDPQPSIWNKRSYPKTKYRHHAHKWPFLQCTVSPVCPEHPQHRSIQSPL